MRKLVSMVAATAFLASTMAAFADGTQTTATAPAQPLAPGGVHKAQMWFAPTGLWIAGGAILVAAGTAVVLSNHTSSTPSTTH
jgi:hypothetical protein